MSASQSRTERLETARQLMPWYLGDHVGSCDSTDHLARQASTCAVRAADFLIAEIDRAQPPVPSLENDDRPMKVEEE